MLRNVFEIIHTEATMMNIRLNVKNLCDYLKE